MRLNWLELQGSLTSCVFYLAAWSSECWGKKCKMKNIIFPLHIFISAVDSLQILTLIVASFFIPLQWEILSFAEWDISVPYKFCFFLKAQSSSIQSYSSVFPIKKHRSLFPCIISFRQTECVKNLSTSHGKFIFNIAKFRINFWKESSERWKQSLCSMKAAEFSVRLFPAVRQDLSSGGLCLLRSLWEGKRKRRSRRAHSSAQWIFGCEAGSAASLW